MFDKIISALTEAGHLDQVRFLKNFEASHKQLEADHNKLTADNKKAIEKRDSFKTKLDGFQAKEKEEALKDIPEDKRVKYQELLDKELSPEQAKKLLDIEVKETENSVKTEVDNNLNKDKKNDPANKETEKNAIETLALDSDIDFAD